MSSIHTDAGVDPLQWSPLVPPPAPQTEVRFVAAVCFISRDAYKYLGVNGLLIGGLIFLWGAGGAFVSVLPAAYTMAIVASEVLRGMGKIRRLRPPTHEPRGMPCPAAEKYIEKWKESRRDDLLRIVRDSRHMWENSFAHDLVSMSEDWRPRGAYRVVYPGRYVRAVREHAAAYNRLVWQANQIRAIAHCASGTRPCAPRLEQWLREHGDRDPGMTGYVQALLAIAREADPRIIEMIARAEEEHRRRAREWEEKKQEERHRYARLLASMPRTPVYYAPAPRDLEAERAADRRWQQAMATLERRVEALDGAAKDFASRGEYVQLEHVEKEQLRLEAELKQWKRIGNTF